MVGTEYPYTNDNEYTTGGKLTDSTMRRLHMHEEKGTLLFPLCTEGE